MGRHILHCDMNSYYASVEMQRRPELRGRPVAVCGSQEERHGIVLTASYPAKGRGVRTGMAIWQAKLACPDLVILPPVMAEYIRISKMAREIYEDYTDQVEAFGLDESWVDVTGSIGLFGDAMTIAKEISDRIKFELGITASIGVSDNKITAKLGSDYKKPVPGTVFAVKDGDGNLLGTYTTGQDGTVTVTGLVPGTTVVVSEVKVPSGYVLDPTPRTIIVKNGSGNRVTSGIAGGDGSNGGNGTGTNGNGLTFENDPLTTLVIEKYIANTTTPLKHRLSALPKC